MFDVIWTDPDRELVGEHRAKKELKRGQREKQQKRGSHPTARSSRSSSDSPFSFLRPHSLRRINTSEENESVRSAVSSQLASPSESSTRSPLFPAFDLQSRPNSDITATRTSFDPSSLEVPSEREDVASSGRRGDRISPGLSRHDSVFSRYAESEGESPKSAAKRSGRDKYRVAMADQTIQSQRDVPCNSGERDHNSQSLSANDSIGRASSADATGMEFGPSDSALQEQNFIRTARSSSTPNAIQAATPLPLQSLEHQQPSTLENPPQMKQALRNRDYSFGERQSTVNEAPAVNGSSDTDTLPPLTLTSHSGFDPWWRHIERLASLSYEKLLSDFTDLLSLEPRLAENEKTKLKLKLLMLWSSNHVDPIIGGTRAVLDRPSTSKRLKVSLLALYESQETTAYLAASFPDYQVFHLSSSPLSTEFAPNIQTLRVPSMDLEHIPQDAEKFGIVSSLQMPALLPVSDIPTALERIAYSLKPRGTFQLTLIDPLPRAATVGPKMGTWLRRYLVPNLEKNSRCTAPRKHFEKWLTDAGLRGQGSTITTTKFFAVSKCVSRKRDRLQEESGYLLDSVYHDKTIKAEIRSHFGRLLWKEVWGSLVTAPNWWWEDTACIEECVELGTIWKYFTIESRKTC